MKPLRKIMRGCGRFLKARILLKWTSGFTMGSYGADICYPSDLLLLLL
jgi:hypothetical protein